MIFTNTFQSTESLAPLAELWQMMSEPQMLQ